jgi:hypothetical protein
MFVILLILGASIIIFGAISYFIPVLSLVLNWSGLLGLGMTLFGGLGTYLTSQVRVREINRKIHDFNVVHPEYRPRDTKPVKNYITTPTQGIFVVSLFLSAVILMILGGLNLLHWLGSLN